MKTLKKTKKMTTVIKILKVKELMHLKGGEGAPTQIDHIIL
jgi:hypothetical protein